jgi:peptide chain release factor 1
MFIIILIMEKSMHNSLEQIYIKYQELLKKQSDPIVASNIKEYQKVAKEINKIKDISVAFEKFLNFQKNFDDSNAMLEMEKDVEMLKFLKGEVHDSEIEMNKINENLKILLLPKDENDDLNAVIEIRGSAGGDEANIFAGDLFRMYQK